MSLWRLVSSLATNGKWVYRDKLNHKCSKPPGGYDVKAGDIWQCDCGQMWRVVGVQHKGDQRDSWWDVQVVKHDGPVPTQNGITVNRVDDVLGGYRSR